MIYVNVTIDSQSNNCNQGLKIEKSTCVISQINYDLNPPESRLK